MSQPFFTIGITTYNRHDLLRETLSSVLSQDFTDFEIIIGNDYQAEVLTCEMLEVTDSRIRIVNYPQNLREVGNMNALLEMASGRYFTWLFDDDLYEPGFLQNGHDCLARTSFPSALFTSFRMLKMNERFQPRKLHAGTMIELTGREFLRWYSADRPQIASTFGLFDTDKLKSIVGKVESLSPSAIGLYSEFHYLVKCALLDRIVYIDAPYYVFRRHADSYSESNLDLENHLVAGHELVRRSAEVLRHPTLVDDFSANLQKICFIHIITFAYKSGRLELARNKFGVGAAYHALSRHWKESSNTRQMYLGQGGKNHFSENLAFLKVTFFCGYLIARHFADYFFRKFSKISLYSL